MDLDVFLANILWKFRLECFESMYALCSFRKDFALLCKCFIFNVYYLIWDSWFPHRIRYQRLPKNKSNRYGTEITLYLATRPGYQLIITIVFVHSIQEYLGQIVCNVDQISWRNSDWRNYLHNFTLILNIW